MSGGGLRRTVVLANGVLAALGPLLGALALLFGEVPLWSGGRAGTPPELVRADIWFGTYVSLAAFGAMAASPVRLWAVLAMRAGRTHRWLALLAAAVVGCLDLSFGPAVALATAALWRREGPKVLFPTAPEPPPDSPVEPEEAVDNKREPDAVTP